MCMGKQQKAIYHIKPWQLPTNDNTHSDISAIHIMYVCVYVFGVNAHETWKQLKVAAFQYEFPNLTKVVDMELSYGHYCIVTKTQTD